MRELLADWRDRTWPHRLLAGQRPEPASVVAVAGGSARAGTTTVVALLATAYAEPGRGRVVVVDAGAGMAQLASQLTVTAGGTVVAPGVDSWSLLAQHLERTAGGVWTVAPAAQAVATGTADAGGPPEADLLAAQAVLAALSPHFAVAVLDCGQQAAPQARFLLGLAHARLLVAAASVDGVLAAAAAADRLELSSRPDLAAHTLVGLVGTRAGPGVDVGVASALLRTRGGEVRWFPYDPALAGGGPIALAELSGGLRATTLAAAAELLRRAGRCP